MERLLLVEKSFLDYNLVFNLSVPKFCDQYAKLEMVIFGQFSENFTYF